MTTLPAPPPSNPPSWLLGNPIFHKEMRGRMRGGRAIAILTAHLAFLSILIGVIFLIALAGNQGSLNIDTLRVMGKIIFGLIIGIQLFTIAFIAPALTAGAIASEREHQTYDLVRATLLPASNFVLGKWFSAVAYLFLLIGTTLPLLSLSFLFGGVALVEVVVGAGILAVTAVSFSALGLFFSSFIKRTTIAMVVTYAAAALILVGIPLFLLAVVAIANVFLQGTNIPNTILLEIALLAGGWMLSIINPIAALLVSELIYLNNGSLFFTLLPLSNGFEFPVLSPWMGYLVVHSLLILALVLLSIWNVRRPAQ
jgi:ABC-type transport system involved in multi-copper enzyme maturation permease subunit